MKHKTFLLLIAAALGQAAACYTYAGVPVADLRPGLDVRAHVSAVAVDRLRRGDATAALSLRDFTITGEVVVATPDSLVLSTTSTVFESGYRGADVTRQVVLTRGEVQSAEARTMNRGKTALVIGASSAALAVAIVGWRNGGFAFGGGRSTGGPAEVRFPVRLHLP
ncbi:MAG TPA: hypothetical protein VLN49_18405 [Gemmatimonadaceae bacterium]|nr:hypothetical protein [Gemmatimonadaceae bacterium]